MTDRPKRETNRELNALRYELGAVIPDLPELHLPPPPSLTVAPNNAIWVRGVNKLDRMSGGKLSHAKKRLRPYRQMLSQLSFTLHDNPEVTIIVPVFNKLELTYECLKSVTENVSGSVSYEVVLVDNNSSDKTHLLGAVKGLRYVRSATNLGFVGGCNLGAEHAKGAYLVFLNNDTYVTKNWLESLHRTIISEPKAGLVGSKILYPDGRLQEAGGVIFKDGTGNNYGKNDHPDRYQYNYVRDVDYCSGASIIIAKKLFDSFGGFDDLYAPAYYEDTDLAFKVRDAGLRVIYQPESIIYHIEGATAGTDTSTGFKKYQAINHKKFLARWGKTLKSKHLSPDELYLARDRSGRKMALIVDEHVPMPDQDSGSVRMIGIIDSLQTLGYKVTFFPNYTKKRPEYTERLEQLGVEVIYGPVLFSEFIKQYGQYYDAVILSRPRIASYYMDLCQAFCTKAKILYDTVDLHYLRLQRQAEFEPVAARQPLIETAEKHEILEKHFISEADTTLVVSDAEERLLKQERFSNVAILSNIHTVNESAYRKGFTDRKDLLFIGGYAHLPNVDAVKWLAVKIFPLVLKELPNVRLHIVGSHMPEDLRGFLTGRKGIVVDGFVKDIDPLLDTTRVFLAPLRYGAGVKGKIGQAIEHGIPVVSTSIGAEGMHLEDRKSCLVADDAHRFAASIVQLYDDPELWTSLQSAAKLVLVKHFSKEAARHTLATILGAP